MDSFDAASESDGTDPRTNPRTSLSANLATSSLRRVTQPNGQIEYISAVAFRLSRSSQKPTLELALEIAHSLSRGTISLDDTPYPLCFDRVWQNFTVHVRPPGWIHLKLHDRGLQEWLNCLCVQLPTLAEPKPQHNRAGFNLSELSSPEDITDRCTTECFTILHTHARCCSLLRLGMQERLIQLEQPDPSLPAWRLSHSSAIAWLNADCRFRCTHPTEQQLIAQIVDVLDVLGTDLLGNAPQQLVCEKLWQLSHCLSQDFQAFHAHCRIFGAIKTSDRALSQTRLGMVFLTQALLHWILRDWLHISPPLEL